MENCELCKFENPKGSVTAAIIKDNKLLVMKRNEEPFKDMWDLPGGYMNKDETPELAMKRELEEELGVKNPHLTFIQAMPGYGFWKDAKFPVISHFYLADISDQNIVLNEENSEFRWVSLKELTPELIAWDSNQDFLVWLKHHFTFDLERVKFLVQQLDSAAEVREQALYKAVLNGYLSKIEEAGLLIGMGWIFPRQTMLRKQAVVEDMIVDEAFRGKGYGKAILEDLLRWAKDQGCEVVELTTNPKRVAAHALYERVGFKIHPTDHMLLNL